MKAAIYPGEGKPVTIEDIPDPEPGPDDVVIKVHRCGICGTDLSFTRGAMFDFGTNAQFGHEYAGEIVAVGSNVGNFKVGENIAALPSVACGECPSCRRLENNVLCQASPGNGMVGFAELAKVPVANATRLPSTLSMADGALVEPLAVSLYGLKLAQIWPGAPVLVLGGGTVGLYTIYWARRLGAGRIVAMSRSDRRKDLCLAMGADAFIPVRRQRDRRSDGSAGRLAAIRFRMRRRRRHDVQGGDACRAIRQDRQPWLLHLARSDDPRHGFVQMRGDAIRRRLFDERIQLHRRPDGQGPCRSQDDHHQRHPAGRPAGDDGAPARSATTKPRSMSACPAEELGRER